MLNASRLRVHSIRTISIFGFVIMSCAVARAGGLIPVHGFVLSPPRRGRLVMRIQRVVGTIHGGTYSVATAGSAPPPGTEVDALVVKRRDGLALDGAPIPAAAFVAGTPNAAVKRFIGDGDRVPTYTLIDQRGQAFRLDRFAGKVTVLSFIFTRCKDVCLTISSKFRRLQQLLDSRNFHLVEVSIDPMYDSPAVLAAYGQNFGAKPGMWSLATGESSIVADVMDSFGVSSLAQGDADYLHNTRLVLIGRHGVVRDVVESAGWDPGNVAATARDLAGMSSNPLRRLWFATFAEVSAFCGGNQSVAVLVVLCIVIPLIASVTIPVLFWFGHRIFSEKDSKPRPAS